MNKKLHVVMDGIIFQTQPHGGISRIFAEILPRMCNQDDSLHIDLLLDGPAQQSLPKHQQIFFKNVPTFHHILKPRRLWEPVILGLRSGFQKLSLGSSKDKIWHSTDYTPAPFWKGKQVVTVYDMIHELYPDLFKGLVYDQFRLQKKRVLEKADCVITISKNTKDDVHKIYNISKEKIVPVLLSCGDVFRPLDLKKEKISLNSNPFFLYVGTRIHYKNFDLLLKAMQRLSDQAIDLVVVGPEWMAQEKKKLQELGLEKRVHLHSKVDDEGLCKLYNQALAFVFPSLYEGFGIPLLEAMACGCPVVASRIPTTYEVAGSSPIYFDKDSLEELVDALRIAIKENRSPDRQDAGFHQRQKFSWEKTALETLECYRQVIQ